MKTGVCLFVIFFCLSCFIMVNGCRRKVGSHHEQTRLSWSPETRQACKVSMLVMLPIRTACEAPRGRYARTNVQLWQH